MSNKKPEYPYIYQPYGPFSHPEKGERLYAVVLSPGMKIDSLTKEEARFVKWMARGIEMLLKITDLTEADDVFMDDELYKEIVELLQGRP